MEYIDVLIVAILVFILSRLEDLSGEKVGAWLTRCIGVILLGVYLGITLGQIIKPAE